MRPICLNCRSFYKAKKNGFFFCEMIPDNSGRTFGWKPYKIWSGDLYECPICHHQIINGVGKAPVSEHFDPDFQDVMKSVEGSVYAP